MSLKQDFKTITDLPNELVVKLLGYLPIKEIYAMSKMCLRFKSIAKPLIEKQNKYSLNYISIDF